MPKPDLILLHAPSVYDFRKENQMFGPISDVVPSTHIFEMYPIGFMTMLGYLEKHGHSVRIINVALKMLKSRRFNVEKLIKSLNPYAFGIDFHWLPHAQGSLALAEIIKKYHPHTPVIFGGLSSSYYHKELIKYPQVDFVLRGDSIEEPLRQLLEKIKTGQETTDVPNLTWENIKNKVMVNKLSHSPDDLDYFPFDYSKIIKSTIRYRDIIGHLPFFNWFSYPVVAILPWRGCTHNCVICGGSAQFYKNYCGRKTPAYRSPKMVAKDIGLISKFLKGPIIILGDIRQAGNRYAIELLECIRREKVKNHIAIELFYPASREYLQFVADAIPNFNIEISPESHDEEIRKTFGRHYGNAGLEQTINDAMELGCKRFDLFFMIGLPKQTPQSVMETVAYCETLINKFSGVGNGKVIPFISPLAPTLDPGSLVFENPKKYGYKFFYRTLEEHRQALMQPSWKYMLNYETKWMSRDEIVECTYDAALELNRIKAKHGIIKQKELKEIESRINDARELIKHIDLLVSNKEKNVTNEELLTKYNAIIKKLSIASICKKEELQWPFKPIRFNIFSILQAILKRN